ncbi:mucin-5AC-like, partial [Mizuhopecten yessoensis]|uniref:mucin-5AC-like n=1 Tax=Mizuhopecten yessoensis TaxID=6573 RepID=UPI000B45D321
MYGPDQSVISVLPLKLPYVDQKGSKVTFLQMQNKTDQEGKVVENIAIPAEIQNLLRQGALSVGGQGASGTTTAAGKGIEQKITFPVGGKALSMASGSKPAETATVGQGKEQRITIPLSQLAAMMGNTAQAQKYGITINLDGKGQKEMSTVSTSLASGGSVLSTGIPVSLMPSSSIPSNINTALQNGGQGQAFLTLMTGANQGQVLTSTLANLGTMATGSQRSTGGNKNIPSTVLEAMDLKNIVGNLSKSPEVQKGATSQTLLSPTKHTVNKDLTSLAEALKTRPPQSLSQVLPTPTVVGSQSRKGTPKQTAAVTSTSSKILDTPGVRNKLVTRLLISGAATSTSPTMSPAIQSSMATSTSTSSPTYNLVFHPNTPLSTTSSSQLSAPVPQTQVINVQNLTKQQLSALTSSGVLVGQTLAASTLVKSDDAHPSPSTVGVTPPATPRVASPGSSGVVSPSVKPSTPRAVSPNLRPELMEQVTIDLKEIQDDSPPVEGETTSTPNCKSEINKQSGILHKKGSGGSKPAPESVKNVESPKTVKKETKKETKKTGKKKAAKSKSAKPKKQTEATEENTEDVTEMESTSSSPTKAEPTKIMP